MIQMAVRILAGMDSEQEGFIDLSTPYTTYQGL